MTSIVSITGSATKTHAEAPAAAAAVAKTDEGGAGRTSSTASASAAAQSLFGRRDDDGDEWGDAHDATHQGRFAARVGDDEYQAVCIGVDALMHGICEELRGLGAGGSFTAAEMQEKANYSSIECDDEFNLPILADLSRDDIKMLRGVFEEQLTIQIALHGVAISSAGAATLK